MRFTSPSRFFYGILMCVIRPVVLFYLPHGGYGEGASRTDVYLRRLASRTRPFYWAALQPFSAGRTWFA